MNAEPEMQNRRFELTGLAKPGKIRCVDGYGSRCGLPRVSRSGFWMTLEPN